MKRETQLPAMFADSLLISADNGHALHPNHPEKSDPTNINNMNDGVVIKRSAVQSYSTDSVAIGIIEQLCKNEDIKYLVNHKKVTVIGTPEVIDNLTAINLSPIDLRSVTASSNTFAVSNSQFVPGNTGISTFGFATLMFAHLYESAL